MTTTVMGLTTEIGDQPLSNLGAWVLPFEDAGLWKLKTELAVEYRTNGPFLVVEPVVTGDASPTFVVESIPRYSMLGGGGQAHYWRWRSLNLENAGSIQIELRSGYSAGGVGNFRAIADVIGFGATPQARYQLSYSDSPSVNETVTANFDAALHRWARIAYDPALGKVRWQAGGPTWVTVLEVDAPSDTLALTDLRIFVSTSSDDALVDDPSAYFGPFNETPDEGTLQLLTEIHPLPEIGPSTELRLVTEVGDDPPDPPDDLDEE